MKLLDYTNGLTAQIEAKGLTPCFKPDFDLDDYREQVDRIKSGSNQLEEIIDAFAGGLTKQLNDTITQNLQIEREKDELSKSLQQIDICYQKNKKKLERDLGKMEYKVKQVVDTREKMQLRHIKGLDIVQNEVNRIMPNSLTERQLGSQIRIDDEEEDKRNTELIRRDLEDVDNVFAANVWSAMKGGENSVEGKDDQAPPEEEWLNTSSEEDVNAREGDNKGDFDVSQDLSI